MILIDHYAIEPLRLLGKYVSDAETVTEALAEARDVLRPAANVEVLKARRAS